MMFKPLIRSVLKALSRMSSTGNGSEGAPARAERASAAQRYFFDVRCGQQIHRDEHGAMATSEAEAIGQAAGAAEDFVKHGTNGRATNIDEIIIRNDHGQEIARVNVRELGGRDL